MGKNRLGVLLRKVGIGLLIAATGATYALIHYPAVMVWVALGLFLGVGAVDIALVVMKQKTISQKIHAAFPQWLDFVILAILMGLTWGVFGLAGFLPVLMGIIFGHLFFYKD